MHTLGLGADDVLTTTRAVRRRLDVSRAVPREVIADCVRIATQAPSGRNRQRWDFVIVDDPALRAKVADVWRRGLIAPTNVAPTAGSRMPLAGTEWNKIAQSLDRLASVMDDVPALLIAGVRVDGRDELATIRGQAGAWGSVLPALWSFMLAARERGIGTAWTTCHLSYEKEMAELLGIPYDQVVQAALTPVAYTVGTSFRPAQRADPRGFVHWNTW
ncbi:nitroreductase family protein [Mycolicibacterium sp. CH28]|uniref:nitroreductase family protein n=1 Tax=Mycolicibacterium sp. CH28 TaxID=2512237 RepID=UPI001081A072|nr:nitroreductase family protein [Mycolicibacterium sp. CH28]TGD84428.1 nitroreductase family protein [Mycolicibacterium sp. CH28]